MEDLLCMGHSGFEESQRDGRDGDIPGLIAHWRGGVRSKYRMGRGRLPRVCPKPAHGVEVKEDALANLMRKIEASVVNGVCSSGCCV